MIPRATLPLLAGCPPFIWPGQHDFGNDTAGETVVGDGGSDTGSEPLPEDTGGTDEPSQYDEPWGFATAFTFAVDLDENGDRIVVAWYDPRDEQVVQVRGTLFLYDAQDRPICNLTITGIPSYSEPFPHVVNGAPEVHSGFAFDLRNSEVSDACEGKLDPARWGSNLAQIADDLQLGTGITSTVAEPVRQALWETFTGTSTAWDRDWEPNLVGARPYLRGSPVNTPNGYAYNHARPIRLLPRDADAGHPSLAWIDTSDDGVWDADEHPDWISAEEVSTASPDRALWIVDTPFITNYDAPLHEVFFGD